MAVLTRFEDYKDKYENVRFERTEDGVVTIQLHTDGNTIKWAPGNGHDEVAYAFGDVAGDPEVAVVILTGAGDDFITDFSWGPFDQPPPATPMRNAPTGPLWSGYQLIKNFLDIEVPCVAAINGPCAIHSELALMCDVVLASDDAWFEDRAHFPVGAVPGDGVHIVWPMVVGQNRGRYFLTTDMRLSAQEAKEWGAVNEIVPKADVLTRAGEIARKIAQKPPVTRRATRHLLTQPFRKAVVNELNHGLFLEGFAVSAFWPRGNTPITQPWHSADPYAPVGDK